MAACVSWSPVPPATWAPLCWSACAAPARSPRLRRGRGDGATAELLDRIGGTVFTTGDHACDSGTAAEFRRCTLAYWHHPLFTSGAVHDGDPQMRPIFQALHDHAAEVVLTGHNHHYERFAPQDADGGRDDTGGIRQFVVGTGGRSHYDFGPARPNSQVRHTGTYGVLELTLHAGRYDWRFVPAVDGSFADSGSGTCH